MQGRINRRQFLRAAAMTAVGVVAASCAQPTPVIVEKQVPVEKIVQETVIVEKQVPVEKVVKETVITEKQVPIEKVVTSTPIPSKFGEAPELAAMVQSGKLPPVEERLPQEPLVLEPYIEVGKYGGTWHLMHLGSIDTMQTYYLTDEFLAKFDADGNIVPNVAKSWEFNGDATTITFHLRQGMKWNDGEPFTTEAVMYWWNDEILNDELNPSKPSAFKIANQLAEVSKVDDYTFTVAFAQPYGGFEDLLPVTKTWSPGHYLKQFHAGYATQAQLDALMKTAGVTLWTDLYGLQTARANNPGTPDIQPWYPTGYVDDPIQIWPRNPYYYKVDTEGNQLPYINEIQRVLCPDAEAILLKAIAGEAEFENRRIEGVANYPTAMSNREKGNYNVVFDDNAGSNVGGTIFFNWYTPNEELKSLYWEKDFRIALSVAIDRNEINDVIFKGVSTPSAVSVAIGSPWYEPEWGPDHPWIKYDPAMANQLLDGLGLTKRDSEGYRTFPSGNRVSMVLINFSSNSSYSPSVEIHEMSKGYWKTVGIEVINKPTERQLWVEQMAGGNFEIGCYISNFGHKTQTPLQQNAFAPVNSSSQYWGIEWGRWYETGGKEGQEPPAPVKEMLRLYELAKADPDINKRTDYIKQVLAIHAEEWYQIGMFNEPRQGRWIIVSNKLGNIPDLIPGTNAIAYNTPLMFYKS